MKYNKLVRDNIPEIIKQKGETPIFHIANESEYGQKLIEKLSEEVEEFKRDNNEEELADIMEVVYAIGEYASISRERLEEVRKKKADERGAFTKRIILDES